MRKQGRARGSAVGSIDPEHSKYAKYPERTINTCSPVDACCAVKGRYQSGYHVCIPVH
ncbi:MAG: hypothetical protein II974_10490 [Firmicutes bacterium]|nr:hypothetical protein [Bacillota bacterium]MBR0441240.1 hypothetical protein [Bacillota bacterium]